MITFMSESTFVEEDLLDKKCVFTGWVSKDEFENDDFFSNDEKIHRSLWSSNVKNVRSTFKNVKLESDELTFSGTIKL